MRESAVQTKIKKWLIADGWFVKKIIQLSENGYPDLYSYKGGRTIWWECKRPGETAAPLQELRIKEIRSFGMEAYVVDSLEEVKSIVRKEKEPI